MWPSSLGCAVRDSSRCMLFRRLCNDDVKRTPSLKRLASVLLDETIQTGEHSSVIDAQVNRPKCLCCIWCCFISTHFLSSNQCRPACRCIANSEESGKRNWQHWRRECLPLNESHVCIYVNQLQCNLLDILMPTMIWSHWKWHFIYRLFISSSLSTSLLSSP